MSSVTYLYDPETPVFVLVPGACAETYNIRSAVVSRVEIKVTSLATSIVYVVTMIDDHSVVSFSEVDVFLDKPTAVAEAITRYQSLFA